MKLLALTALIIGIGVIPNAQTIAQAEKQIAESNSTSEASAAEKSKQDKQTAEAEAVQGILTQMTQIEQQNAQVLKEIKDQKTEDATINAKIKSYTFWLVVVGAIQALILAVTVFAVFHQTRTSRDTERAWVIASPKENAPRIGFISTPGSNLEAHLVGANEKNVFSCSFNSTGHTPARLVEVAIRYLKVNRLADVPKDPDYGERIPLNDLPLVTTDSIGFMAFLEPDAILNKTDADAVQSQEAFLYACGVIVYRDVYNRSHENRFGYVYHFPQRGDPKERGFRREGLPPSYNRAT